MKLVTYRSAGGDTRIGVLADDLTTIIDLDRAHQARRGASYPAFADMLALIDGGTQALDVARNVVETTNGEGIEGACSDLAETTLLAPVPEPRQMRDCLAFEQHLIQAREQRYRKLAARAADPEAAWAKFEASGQLAAPDIWYRQPIYYKQNRFSVVGPETEIAWPRYRSARQCFRSNGRRRNSETSSASRPGARVRSWRRWRRPPSSP